MMNPAMLLQLKQGLSAFENRHPKFMNFLHYAAQNCLQDGSVLDVTVKNADGRNIHANLRLTQEDLQMLEQLKALKKQSGE